MTPDPVGSWDRIRGAVEREFKDNDLEVPELFAEPGRSIVGSSAVTLYRVGTIKRIPGVRTYVSVDGGMSDNIRPALYGARYEAFSPTAWMPQGAEGHAVGQALRIGRRSDPRRSPAR